MGDCNARLDFVVVACLIHDTLCRDYVRSSHQFNADCLLLSLLMTDFIQYMSLYNLQSQ